MLKRRILNGLLLTASLALLGACSTPCLSPGGLCAPIEANTSAAASGQRADQAASRPALPLTTPAPEATVQTMAIEMPGAKPGQTPAAEPETPPIRMALILPLRSEALGAPAESVRDGFMAAYERDKAGFIVTVIETTDSSDETLDAYMAAKKNNDIIVGPLARSAVSAVAASGTVSKPTIALNHPEGRGVDNPIPPAMLVIGLSIEDEARQVANWASAEHPAASAIVVSGTPAWQRRIAAAFVQQWKQLGNTAQVVEMPGSNGYVADDAVNQLKARIDADAPTLLFAALDADQLRQVRAIVGTALPTYGTSSVNPGREAGGMMAELEGTRMLDLPWQVNVDHAAVMQYPRSPVRRSLDMERLYALGIDAFRVAREVARNPGTSFRVDGVTGKLNITANKSGARFERTESPVVYQSGAYRPVDKKR